MTKKYQYQVEKQCFRNVKEIGVRSETSGTREIASAFSSAERYGALVLRGVSGNRKNPYAATGRVMMPSMMNLYKHSGQHKRRKRRMINSQPSPSRKALETVHAGMYTSLNETTNHRSCQPRCGENSGSLAELLLSIPRPKDIVSSNECGRLKNSLEETNSHNMLRLLSSRSDHC